MCGQFEALIFANKLMDEMRLEGPAESQVVKPTLGASCLIANPDHGGIEMATMRFGLVPLWYRKSLRDWTATTFNARIEEVDTKATFKGAWRYRRCVVPAEAFFEWSGPKTDRTKWRITRADNQPLAFAGIWDQADVLEGEVFSFSLLTRAAGADMSAIHTREPVVLGPDHWEDWMRIRPVDLRTSTPLRLSRVDEAKSGQTLSLF
ncbi:MULTISPECIES: SOS response-associated peptidase [Asticcacaulis]|uniref:SOS response-associated peptidase n=1 Tax=Asticcacaulis TaxID=76890 RepID=UPI001AE1D41D|nr:MULTISPECIES: SOS response-associated peptidase [Asticcacaulis]MBP2160831.1 putative SOS response-associated peptidase YedK [Asticcacaulis solisilvae]MDR6801965.1 putative SOS response-associated peptidase YedK [Asticcacaulis sp. BE141]